MVQIVPYTYTYACIQVRGVSFHATATCFKCVTCLKYLAGGKATVVGTALYCPTHYHDARAILCRRCGKAITATFTQVRS